VRRAYAPADPVHVAQALAPCLGSEPIAAAWLYGSVARGDARSASDVDLGVLLATHLRSDRRRVLREIERSATQALPGRQLSVVDLEMVPLLLRHRVLRDGMLLVELDAGARSRFAARVLEAFCATRPIRSSFDAATRYRLGLGAAAVDAV